MKSIDPRLIQGTSHISNVIVGPWMHAFSKKLAACWNGDGNVFYTSGCHTEDFSLTVDNAVWNTDYVVYETDFSRFDSTVSKPFLNLELEIYGQYGIPKLAAQFVRAKINTRGYTSTGIKYRIEGTRQSGEPNTSCGNTLINVLLHRWILHCNGIKDFSMLCLGDDNLLIIPTHKTLDMGALGRLGFRPKTTIHKDIFASEFCSMIPLPARNKQGQEVVLFTPKPGRILAKFGIDYENAPHSIMLGRMRANILGLLKDVWHVRFLRDILCHTLGCIVAYRDVTLPDHHRLHVREGHEPWESFGQDVTENVLLRRYGSCKAELQAALELFLTVRNLPVAVNHPFFEKVCRQDCGT